jgi:hypothetical protein
MSEPNDEQTQNDEQTEQAEQSGSGGVDLRGTAKGAAAGAVAGAAAGAAAMAARDVLKGRGDGETTDSSDEDEPVEETEA